jgi:hypothetical protein
MQASSSKG